MRVGNLDGRSIVRYLPILRSKHLVFTSRVAIAKISNERAFRCAAQLPIKRTAPSSRGSDRTYLPVNRQIENGLVFFSAPLLRAKGTAPALRGQG
jgi:hypothetical protein